MRRFAMIGCGPHVNSLIFLGKLGLARVWFTYGKRMASVGWGRAGGFVNDLCRIGREC